MDNRASEQPGRWRRRCFSLADQYGLSEREVDIFILLAKGRNAPYIGKQLYVSESTVRSHIQHIYAKMDIHSQQDLIDLVEREQ